MFDGAKARNRLQLQQQHQREKERGEGGEQQLDRRRQLSARTSQDYLQSNKTRMQCAFINVITLVAPTVAAAWLATSCPPPPPPATFNKNEEFTFWKFYTICVRHAVGARQKLTHLHPRFSASRNAGDYARIARPLSRPRDSSPRETSTWSHSAKANENTNIN